MTNTTPRTPRTTRTRRTRGAALLVAPILALSLAACGDDDTDEPPPVATDPVITDPGVTDPDEDMSAGFDDSTIIGLSVEEARVLVENDDRQFRVARVDGEDQALTADLVEGRVNVVVEDGTVESVAFYG